MVNYDFFSWLDELEHAVWHVLNPIQTGVSLESSEAGSDTKSDQKRRR